MIRVTARILLCYQKRPFPSFRNIIADLEPCDLERSESMWIRTAQKDLGDLKKYVRLSPKVREDGIIIVGCRCEAWLDEKFENRQITLLPYNHMLSKLYATYIHKKGHLGVSATVCKIRNRHWIVNVVRLVKDIVNKCVECRKQRKVLEEQIMAPLPADRRNLHPLGSRHT